MSFFRKTVPVYFVVIIVVVLSGIIFVSGSFNTGKKQEKVISWEETGIISHAEELVQKRKAGAGMSGTVKKSKPVLYYNGHAKAASMPLDSMQNWLTWMKSNVYDSSVFLNQRWELSKTFIESGELRSDNDIRAFLITPREHFVREKNKGQEYADTWLPIGWGATITDPDVVAMMTTTLNIKQNDKVLEIGTGSGYQSAILSYLSYSVYSIEIIEPLFYETDKLYKDLENIYPAYKDINRKLGDGYYGWEEYAPFDKIIVTCSIDHIPPPLLKQLKTGGIMVLPLGPPGRQYIMEIRKNTESDGSTSLARRDVYNGLWVHFIPFRNEDGKSYSK